MVADKGDAMSCMDLVVEMGVCAEAMAARALAEAHSFCAMEPQRQNEATMKTMDKLVTEHKEAWMLQESCVACCVKLRRGLSASKA